VRGQGRCLAHPTLKAIAGRHGRSAAQALLRWHIESGFVAIPKSATPARIAENIDVFDVELTKEDRIAIASLDRADGRTGPDPLTFGRMPMLRGLIGRRGYDAARQVKRTGRKLIGWLSRDHPSGPR
jgi:2,5-diketo-D-gluconate reductase A